MRAIVCKKHGPPEVLQKMEMPTPRPGSTDVLIKIHASPVTSGDRRIRALDIPIPVLKLPLRMIVRIIGPFVSVLGRYFAGEVAEAGSSVKRFKTGDRVYVRASKFGGFAEYASIPEDSVITLMPGNVTYEEAAAIPFGGACAIHFLKRKAKIEHGQSVLIYGASGAVGSAAVQVAKIFGAHVTGVCGPDHISLVESLGADQVINYQKQDYLKLNYRYDIIFDAVGKISKRRSKKAIHEDGIYVSVFTSGVAKITVEDLLMLKDLVERGLFKAVIDRCYPLEKIA
ncbi:MAG: zinc-binding dehydrogenase, partial [Chitinivibrionales bacterium]|nr:zinc-binding dehydrogenase [Chitinivibrionales bacterium]